jgi:hypothetical protein
MIYDLSDTIAPKSDQLNADDFLSGAETVYITEVVKVNNPDQPVLVYLAGHKQPYKPGKSMRRVLINAWGKSSANWIGKYMTLFNDTAVSFGPDKTGGIRVSHVSGIDEPKTIPLTLKRGKRKPYTVQPLIIPAYPQSEFDNNLPIWQDAISKGKTTAADVIAKVRQKGTLTESQKAAIQPVEDL